MGGIGPVGIILIVLVALLLFGPSKLPELGRAFGRTLKEFKKGTKEIMEDDEEDQPKRKEVNRVSDQQLESRKTMDDKDDNKRLPD